MASTSNNIGQQSGNAGQCHYIAINPSGKELAILNCKEHTLVIWHIQSPMEYEQIFKCKLKENIGITTITTEENWSLAISDADEGGEILIALSWFNFSDNPPSTESGISSESSHTNSIELSSISCDVSTANSTTNLVVSDSREEAIRSF